MLVYVHGDGVDMCMSNNSCKFIIEIFKEGIQLTRSRDIYVFSILTIPIIL